MNILRIYLCYELLISLLMNIYKGQWINFPNLQTFAEGSRSNRRYQTFEYTTKYNTIVQIAPHRLYHFIMRYAAQWNPFITRFLCARNSKIRNVRKSYFIYKLHLAKNVNIYFFTDIWSRMEKPILACYGANGYDWHLSDKHMCQTYHM